MTTNVEFWKQKLAAFLHDPPSKCLDLSSHGKRAEQAYRQAGLIDEEVGKYLKDADHISAAADRIPFPSPSGSGMRCAFDGVKNCFIHPLGNKQGEKLTFKFHKEFPSAELAIEGENSVQPCLEQKSLNELKDEDERWRARFFAHWRLWRKHAIGHDYRLGFLPADTRIPDHSIWLHMQIASAVAGCIENEKIDIAFLKFQIGPVQEFIAAARSIRDLWSGSYLLSWLMASGLKALTEEVGPDSVIYPSLYGQPIFDLHWRDDLWNKVKIGSETVWSSFKYKEAEILTPNLPNVFLAIVPQKRSSELAKKVESR
ncbi:MAG: type III-B CRISPR-associated protein Cas10/Cmr2, partial [Verrucomicrobiae bacterium]|nr:type III-B CRISPR-associated protein Cas10/Cmr2 [Verrucomicrobiae bacterium]